MTNKKDFGECKKMQGYELCMNRMLCDSPNYTPKCESILDYPLDGITVYIGFDEPVCGGTFDWIEARLRWLEAETGLSAATPPISYYWLREDVYDHCPTGACASPSDNTIYTPLELFSHELVHGHLAQLGLPGPWMAEGMARMLEDTRWDVCDPPMTPSMMLETTKTIDLDYPSAASFVGYLRDRFGMPALLELYAALDHVDAKATPNVFRETLGQPWDVVEAAYLAAYTPPTYVGSINCDFPELEPEAGTWTFPITSSCEDAGSIGPFLGWIDTDSPRIERYVIVDIPEAGIYSLSMTSSATVSIELIACDQPLRSYNDYGTRLDQQIEFVPGRKRLKISPDIADETVGQVVIRGPLSPP